MVNVRIKMELVITDLPDTIPFGKVANDIQERITFAHQHDSLVGRTIYEINTSIERSL